MTAYPRFHRAALSRGVAGVRGRTLIVNLPGSPGGVRDGLTVLDDLVEHAVELIRGTNTGH
jgi:molybdopterin biosynthesis enzyme MoaB